MELKITAEKGARISKDFIGLFIEDINYAIDGGLYAQLLENGNFESVEVFGGKDKDYYVKPDGLYAWDAYPDSGDTRLAIVEGSPVSVKTPHYLRVETLQEECGFCNKAYDGIHMRPDVAYHISFYARNAAYSGGLSIAVVKDGKTVCEKKIRTEEADPFGWHKWVRYSLDIRSAREVRNALFVVRMEEKGIMEFDHFSMMPEDAVCGVFRKDLAELLRDLHPGFLRFPGGCVVEGATLANRYNFKDTLGEREGRKHNWNRWALHGNNEENHYHSRYAHYGQTYGIGFYEYFLLCEYLGAKPLPVLGVGLACQFQSHEKAEPGSPEIYEYIQDYLDLIEFANGGKNTRWGSVRAQMGHEEPFGLEMVGVGNEQWEDGESRFFERYLLFEREIHKVYPKIRLIGTAGPELDSSRFQAAWDFYRGQEDKENFVYAVDEHYYTKPDWFVTHTDYFDKVPRNTKIFFGEYAAHPMGWMPMNSPEGNNLEGALAEAAFLCGMARNSDVVVMTCYAPLFARIGYAQWNPDLIWFDEKQAYRTPNYFVQQMFAANLGDYNIGVESKKDGEIHCQISFSEEDQELIIKLVNISPKEEEIRFDFHESWKIGDGPIKETVLAGNHPEDMNSMEKEQIKPREKEIILGNGTYQVPPFSFSILRITLDAKQ